MVKVGGKLTSLHRSRIDIIADVLRAAVNGAKKTHIMYGCNLSYKQLQAYLNLLLDRGLLRTVSEQEHNNRGIFKITDKGETLLQAYRSLKALLVA